MVTCCAPLLCEAAYKAALAPGMPWMCRLSSEHLTVFAAASTARTPTKKKKSAGAATGRLARMTTMMTTRTLGEQAPCPAAEPAHCHRCCG